MLTLEEQIERVADAAVTASLDGDDWATEVVAGRSFPRAWLAVAAGLMVLALIGGLVVAVTRGERSASTADLGGGAEHRSTMQPIELTEQQRADAIATCANETLPTSAIVDGRTTGVLVGLTIDDVWRTCRFSPTGGARGPMVQVGDVAMDAPSAPLSLIPDTTAEWPISVIDAKAPDGNGLTGDEVTWVWGRVDPSIVTVVIRTATADHIPTVNNGLFAASWLGNNGDETVVRGFDVDGNEVAFSDQLNCAAFESVVTPSGEFTPMRPRLVVRGEYAGGGCIGGEYVPAGQSPDHFGD